MLFALALCYLSFVCLLLAMPKYRRALAVKNPVSNFTEKCLRATGWTGLIISLVVLTSEYGFATGLTGLCGVATLAGIVLTLSFSYFPQLAVFNLHKVIAKP